MSSKFYITASADVDSEVIVAPSVVAPTALTPALSSEKN